MFDTRNAKKTLFFFVGQIAKMTTDASQFTLEANANLQLPTDMVDVPENRLPYSAVDQMQLLNGKEAFFNMLVFAQPREVPECRNPYSYNKCVNLCAGFQDPQDVGECIRGCWDTYCR